MLLLHPLAVSLLGLKLHLVYLSLQALDQRSLLLSLPVPYCKFLLYAIELLPAARASSSAPDSRFAERLFAPAAPQILLACRPDRL